MNKLNYILDAKQMKAVDINSIDNTGIPSIVLMERAALSVSDYIKKDIIKRGMTDTDVSVICVCGKGNNGADGLAAARQLFLSGIRTCIYEIGNKEGTEEYIQQRKIVKNLGVEFVSYLENTKYDYIVDAIFGIGLSRDVEGKYAGLIELINKITDNTRAKVVSVDIPSGIDASSGKVMNCAVKAAATITFGYAKLGQILYPGTEYCGRLIVADIGFAPVLQEDKEKYAFTFTEDDIKCINDRKADGNKGTFGKVLIAAGSKTMGGAAMLSAKSAYRTGCGLVKVCTHEINRQAVLSYVPESLISTYNDNTVQEELDKCLEWPSVVAAGPGISKDDNAKKITVSVMNSDVPVKIFDADALNVIAKHNIEYNVNEHSHIIITPHIGEMSRLTGMTIDEIKQNIIECARNYAAAHKVICVLKDARTIVTDGEKVYINTSGNDGMATGGSGDVLTGIIAGLAAQKNEPFKSACFGVYLHGRAGDMAALQYGRHGMLSGDITDFIGNVLK